MSLFDALGTASRALQVNQKGLAVAGHNIANVETEGYSRQRQRLQSALANVSPAGNIGTGVEQVTIERVTDQFTQARLYQETATLGSTQTQKDLMTQVEAIFNEQGTEGLTTQLSTYFNAWESLQATSVSEQPTERNALLASGQSLVDTISRMDRQLRDLQESANRTIVAMLPEINSLSQRISELNVEIVKQEAVAPANDLRDQREELMRQLSEKVEISSFENTNGTVNVMIGGGVPLVTGADYNQLQAAADPTNSFNASFVTVNFVGGGNNFDVKNLIGGGELGGYLASRDTDIADAIRELDAFAYNLARKVNDQHQAGYGVDASSPGGHDFFAFDNPPGLGTTTDDAASLLSISADIDPAQGGDVRRIAAASVEDPPGSGLGAAGDRANAQAIAALRNAQSATWTAGSSIAAAAAGPSQSILQLGSDVIGDVGQLARTLNLALEQQENVLRKVQDRRDSISGVALEEEMGDLIRLQAAFQANSRIVVTVNRMFDSLIAAFS